MHAAVMLARNPIRSTMKRSDTKAYPQRETVDIKLIPRHGQRPIKNASDGTHGSNSDQSRVVSQTGLNLLHIVIISTHGRSQNQSRDTHFIFVFLCWKHVRNILEFNNVTWLISLVDQNWRSFLAANNYICLVFKVLLEVLQKAVLINNLSKCVNLPFVVIKEDIELGNVSSTCSTFPVIYHILMLAQVTLVIIS